MRTLAVMLSAVIAALTIFTGTVSAEESKVDSQKIIITRNGSVDAVKGPSTTFTGDVSVEFLIPKRGDSRMSGGLVTFSQGARSNWHTHPYGQILIITAGKGQVQQWGEPVQKVLPGDIVWFPAGVKHWHGGSPDSSMSHYSIQEELDGQAADWMEKVTDEQYHGKE